MTTKLDDSGVTFADGSIMNSAAQLGMRNKLINGNPLINQEGFTAASTTYSAGVYIRDMWKAGAGGCTLSFSTTANIVTVTITAGTMVSIVEGLSLQSGTHVLSWIGTATGRIDGGIYGVSGITGTATGGTNLSVEFGTGTLSLVQFEKGAFASIFEFRFPGTELALCQRYFENSNGGGGTYSVTDSYVLTTTATTNYPSVGFRASKYATPTLTIYPAGGTGAVMSVSRGAFYQSANHSGASTYGWTAAARL